MSWNYRVVKYGEPLEEVYLIHEVHYNKRGKIEGWSDGEMRPLGSSLKELRGDLKQMTQALKLPVLQHKNGKLVPAN